MTDERVFAEFGKPMLASHFPHVAAAGDAMLNSGSFGLAPKSVLDRKIQVVQEFESYGDKFVRQGLLRYHLESVRATANLLGLDPEQCALVDNVTTGVSNILNCIVKPGDAILVNSWTYGSVRLAAELATGAGSEASDNLVCFDLKLPLKSAEEIVDRVREAFDRRPDIRIAIFDHITSSTACIMPVHQLTELAHSRGAIVIIDGAHAIGQIPNLDIAAIGAEFYLGNLHKWCFAPKSSALLWVANSDLSRQLRPTVVSWLLQDPSLWTRYAFLGTRDTSSVCAVTQAVTFVRDVCGGLDRIHAYCTRLADKASQHLTRAWDSNQLPLPDSMRAPFMRLIALPEHLQCPEIVRMTKETRLTSPMWDFLLNRLKMNLLILEIKARLYVRISCSVIVAMEDIEKLAAELMKLKREDFLTVCQDSR